MDTLELNIYRQSACLRLVKDRANLGLSYHGENDPVARSIVLESVMSCMCPAVVKDDSGSNQMVWCLHIDTQPRGQ